MSSRPSPTLRPPRPASGPTVAVARQPILDRRQRVFGYELQFGSDAGAASFADGEPATVARAISDAMLHIGVDAVAGGSRAFLKVGREYLLQGVQTVLPPEKVVVELAADVDADAEVLRACRDLRDAGYAIAIDDFVLTPATSALVPVANYLKIDFRRPARADARARTVACLRPGVTAMIATNVETFDEFEAAARDGFTLFQGFFIGRPLLLPARDVPGQHVATLRLLRALNDPNLPVAALEELVSHDAALCYRILRTVNSWAYAQRRNVQSMHDALMLLGREAVRRWASLYAVAGLGERAPSELVVMATVRARTAELLAASVRTDDTTADAFLLGMCSLLDVMLGRPMPLIVAELPLEDETKRALCGEANPKRRLLDCVIAYERGDWTTCAELARSLRINPAVLPGATAEALRWAQELRQDGVRS